MVRRRKRSKKWIFWLFFLILLIAAGYVCYAVWDGYFNDDKEEVTHEEEKKDEEDKVKIEEKVESESEGSETIVQKEEVVQYDGENPNNSGEITGVVTYAGVAGDKLMIRMNIDQYLSGGECALRLIEYGDEVYSDVAGLDSSASTTTCMGFDIPVAAIGGGSFQIIIDVNSGGKNGTITGEVSI